MGWLDEAAVSWLDDITPAPQVTSAVEAEDFRGIMASFPTGITVVTTLDAEQPRGVTVSAFASISLDPPILMVSLALRSRTLAAIQRHGAFAVHVLESSASDLSQRFAAPTSSFDGIAWTPSERAGGVPVLQERTVAHAECVVHSVRFVGDHAIVLGQVVGGASSETAPLVYHRRNYLEWARPQLTLLTHPEGTS